MEPELINDDFQSLETFLILLKAHPALGFLLALSIGLTIRELVTVADIILVWLREKLIGGRRRTDKIKFNNNDKKK